MESRGLTPLFEVQVKLNDGRSRFIDLVGRNQSPHAFDEIIQFVKTNSSGTVIRVEELTARTEIASALKIPEARVRFIDTSESLRKR